MFRIILLTIIIGSIQTAFGQKNNSLDNRVNLLFGLNQPLVDGFNIEANVFYKRLAFDYSHGVSLDFPNNMLSGDEEDQQLTVHLPYSTGFGIGYRFTNWFNLRVEPKWHKFELYYEGESQSNQNRIVSYNTFSLGLGAYINWRPFKNLDNLLKGFMVSPSIRYWPKLSSSLDNDTFDYNNRMTNQVETHKAMEIGIANTPLIVNVSVGYTITF